MHLWVDMVICLIKHPCPQKPLLESYFRCQFERNGMTYHIAKGSKGNVETINPFWNALNIKKIVGRIIDWRKRTDRTVHNKSIENESTTCKTL